jgi:hypothetical protein
MTPLTQLLDQHIQKPLGDYLEEDALVLVLKRRLTKKEHKLLLARAHSTPTRTEIQAKLSLDDERYEALWQNVIKKINRDSIKQELFSY